MNVDELWNKWADCSAKQRKDLMTKDAFTKAIAEVISLPVDALVKANQIEPLVSRKFAEENIKKRYDMICKQIELWQKRIEKEWSYEDGYKNGLTCAEKQFRNLFS